ncbi:MAG: Ig domain-containing protein [Lachnospiraceae bacterium]|nr:Ig domain-containing protein [Lachnospiraceae bacterium]
MRNMKKRAVFIFVVSLVFTAMLGSGAKIFAAEMENVIGSEPSSTEEGLQAEETRESEKDAGIENTDIEDIDVADTDIAEKDTNGSYPREGIADEAEPALISGESTDEELDNIETGEEAEASENQTYRPWCSEFASWCAYSAKIPENIINHTHSSHHFMEFFVSKGRYYYVKGGIDSGNTDFMKKYGYKNIKTIAPSSMEVGDLLLLETHANAEDGPDHTAIFLSYKEGEIENISGNRSHAVKIGTSLLSSLHGVCKPQFDSGSRSKSNYTLSASFPSKIAIGEKIAIKTMNAKGKLTYQSSDSSIATVDKRGNVVGKKQGEVEIIVKSAATGTYNVAYKILPVKVKTTLSKTARYLDIVWPQSIYVGTTKTIQVSGAKNKVSYQSSNKAIAKISSSGKVRGMKPGNVTITITTKIGKNTYRYWNTISIMDITYVKSVSLGQKTASVGKGHKITLKVSYKPVDATNKEVTWTTSNQKIATVSSNGVVRGVKKGKATISVTTKDGKKKASCKVTVK